MASQIGTTRAFTTTTEYTDPNKRLCPQCGVYSVPAPVEPRIMVNGIFEESCKNCGHVYGRDALLGNRPIVVDKKVTAITVTGQGGATTITTDKGTLQMLADVQPPDAADKSVTWSVDSTSAATIDASGLLTAKANGKVTATATANDGSGVFGSLEVTISGQLVKVTSITVDGQGGASTITTDKGTLQMTATVLPANATDKSVTWSVTNGSGAATISASGLLSATKNGTVTVKATAKDGSGKEGTKQITISGQVVAVAGVSVDGTGGASTITTNGGTLQMVATVTPADATNKSVTWSVDNAAIATIDTSGKLTAKANGTVTVTANSQADSTKKGTKAITISGQVIPVTGVTVTGTGGATTIDTDKGTLQMVATVAPANATNKSVSWSVDNTAIATINTSGLLTAVADGSVVVTATSQADATKKGTATITVTNQA